MCKFCGCQAGEDTCLFDISKSAKEKKLEDDIAFLSERLADYRSAFIAIWDSATDVLSQEDIDRIQTVNSLDFRTLGR